MGNVIFKQGDKVDGVYMIIEGAVEIRSKTKIKQEINTKKPTKYFE